MAGIFVFPAPAGINRAMNFVAPRGVRVPRASGDKPMVNMNLMSILGCSPRQRG
ncbi:hypothetical protein ISM32_001707 [Salmonella enterica]|nr:hypothetical protein [Salmonella enterica]EHF7034627.1 hypothetical protein [Salmonella enterica]QDX90356.1 hypothetical protein FORC93_4308 [Salmonella enterica subsp. enterica serovar Braenderup]